MRTNSARRSGFTLIELSTVMLALAVFLLVATSFLNFCMRQGSDMKRREQLQRDWIRLSRTFREDAEASSGLEAVASDSATPSVWRLASVDGEKVFEYRFLEDEDRVERNVYAATALAEPIARESYALAPSARIDVDRDESEPKLAVLRLRPPADALIGNRRVEAILNRGEIALP